jgi:hypothetical protein
MLPKRNLVILAVLEGLVMFSAIVRMVIPGLGIDFGKQPHLIWFVLTMMLSGSAVAHYVIRSMPLQARLRAEEPVEDDLKQILGLSLALVGLAAMVSLAGPQLFERLLG